MAMQQAGLIVRWKSKWWGAQKECPIEKDARKVKPLDLESVGGAFMVLGCAITLGFLLLLGEMLLNIRHKHRSKNWTPSKSTNSDFSGSGSTVTLETICKNTQSAEQIAHPQNDDEIVRDSGDSEIRIELKI
jgi:hypothetical protein